MDTVNPRSPRLFSWFLALLIPIFAVYLALFNAIEEHAYDAAQFHIFRGVVWSAARADGTIYPRWVQSINGGLGGPLFEFYSPLSYFLMDVLNQLGIPHPLAWRILTAIFLVVASAGMFGLALVLFKRAEVALLSAAIFTYNSYLLRDLFERGSPQGFAVALLPLLLWLWRRSAENPSGVRIALVGICFAAMILIHNATALLLLPVIAIFVVFLVVEGHSRALGVQGNGRELTHHHAINAELNWLERLTRGDASPAINLWIPLACLIAGLALAVFYLVPYLAEIQFVQFDNPLRAAYALPATHPLRLEDILTLPRAMDTGLGNNAVGEGGGLLHAAVLLLAIPVGLRFYRAKRWAELVWVMGNGLLVVLVLWLQTDSATFVWNAIPVLNVFQFRWRLLSVMGFVSAMVFGYFVLQLQTRFRSLIIGLLIIGYGLLAFPSLYPNLLFRYVQFPANPTVADAQAFALKTDAPGLTSFNEYLPRWRQVPITSYTTDPIAHLPSSARISNESHSNGYLRAQIETPTQFTAAMNVLYYPGWVGYVDGQAQTIAPTAREGLIALEVPAGTHTVELRYEGTNAQRVGDAVSIVAVVALVLLTILLRPRRRDQMPLDSDLAPGWWIPTAIIALAAFKAFWIDPHTTWFRATSTCDAIQEAIVQTNVAYDTRIRLCGYALSRTDLQANDPLRITLYWELESPATANAFSFVHLLGGKFNPETGNPLWGQQDKQTPAEHTLTDWVAGKVYRDVYEFRIAPHAPSGEYQLEIGWQDANGRRLVPRLVASAKDFSVSHLDSLLMSGIVVR